MRRPFDSVSPPRAVICCNTSCSLRTPETVMKLTRMSTRSLDASSRRISCSKDGEPLPAVKSHGAASPSSGGIGLSGARCTARSSRAGGASRSMCVAAARSPFTDCSRWRSHTSSSFTSVNCRCAASAPSPGRSSSKAASCRTRISARTSAASSATGRIWCRAVVSLVRRRSMLSVNTTS